MQGLLDERQTPHFSDTVYGLLGQYWRWLQHRPDQIAGQINRIPRNLEELKASGGILGMLSDAETDEEKFNQALGGVFDFNPATAGLLGTVRKVGGILGNGALDRAKSMGMHTDMPLWHGGKRGIKEFDLKKGGDVSRSPVGQLGVSAALDKETAREFAGRISNNDGEIYQLLHRADNPAKIDLSGDELNSEIAATVRQAWDDGFDSILFTNYTTPGGKIGKQFVLVKNPNQLRSVRAKFDPNKRESANI